MVGASQGANASGPEAVGGRSLTVVNDYGPRFKLYEVPARDDLAVGCQVLADPFRVEALKTLPMNGAIR